MWLKMGQYNKDLDTKFPPNEHRVSVTILFNCYPPLQTKQNNWENLMEKTSFDTNKNTLFLIKLTWIAFYWRLTFDWHSKY